MKKLFAILLALCLLLAALPALGEAMDFSGMWYVTLADVDLGWFQLNGDGTLSADIVGVGPAEGSWSSEGDTVTITLNGSPVEFTWTGEMLWSTSLYMPVVREQGSVPNALVSAYFDNQEVELPEGMTQEDLATVAKNFEDAYYNILAMDAASKKASLDVDFENFYVLESYSGYRAVWVAQVMNLNPQPVYLHGGEMHVLDADGNEIGKVSYFSSRGSSYLEPGEYGFISMEADIPENNAASYTYSLEVDTDAYGKDAPVTLADPGFFIGEDEYARNTMWVTATNDTDAPMEFNVAYALKDSEGTIWYVDQTSLYLHELCPGSSMIVKANINSRVFKYLKENGIKISAIETTGWYDIDD